MKALLLLLTSAALLTACGDQKPGTATTTPTATLGTDSAATKVGGMPAADTAGAVR